MIKVKFPIFSDEIDKAITEIYRVEGQIKSVSGKLKTNDISNDDFEVFLDNMEKLILELIRTNLFKEHFNPFSKNYIVFF